MADVRLDRFLANEEAGTRSEVKKFLAKGRVRVNGQVVKRPETKIDPGTDRVELDGMEIRPQGRVCLMMNKPSGVLSATKDGRTRTVIDLLGDYPHRDVFPAGRLDIDTEGFLLLTNDGQLAHRVLSPAHHVAKTYFAIIDGDVDAEMMQKFQSGLDIGDDKPTKAALLFKVTVDGDFIGEMDSRIDSSAVTPEIMQKFCLNSIALSDFARCGEEDSCVALAITEGRFHQVKRMFEAVGRHVLFLKRIAMGPIALDSSLEPGEFRPLSEEELAVLDAV